MTSACIPGERLECWKQRSCFSADYPYYEQQRDIWDVQPIPYKENASWFIQEAPENQKKRKSNQSKSPAVPPGTWPCDRKKSYAEPPMQMPTELAKEQMPQAANQLLGLGLWGHMTAIQNCQDKERGSLASRLVRVVAPGHRQLFQEEMLLH